MSAMHRFGVKALRKAVREGRKAANKAAGHAQPVASVKFIREPFKDLRLKKVTKGVL
jgi:hypothetical protein